jgi:hypothetical protein
MDSAGVRLRRFRSEQGRELLDLPDAPLAEPELAAPIRFLPEYDNVHFGYRHRERINPHRFEMPRRSGNGAIMGTFLADGGFAGEWRRQVSTDGQAATLTVHAYRRLTADEHGDMHREGRMLLAFLAPDAVAEVQIVGP